jgi:hypothetical protein
MNFELDAAKAEDNATKHGVSFEEASTAFGDLVSASISLPWDRREEPYIRIATGDFPSLLRRRGRDNALAAFLGSLSHEVLRYQQWIKTGRSWERGVVKRAADLVHSYAETVDHPNPLPPNSALQ